MAIGALTACSSSGSGGSTDGKSGSDASQSAPAAGKGGAKLPPKEALLASAAVMEKAGSAKLTLKDADGGGSADYVWKDPSSFLMTSQEEGKEVKVLFVGGQMYVGATPDMAAAAKGKKWLSLDVKDGSGDSDNEVGSFAAAMQVMNPAVQLAAAAPTATAVGTETVAGQSTTHYHSQLKAEDLAAKMNLDPALKAKALAQIKKEGDTVSADVWINGKGELVQQTVVDPTAEKGGAPLTVTYSDLGQAKATPAPTADQVFKLSDLMQQ
ncbi:hypothetical protein ACFY00_26930 [Kitasatospora sp. NPDC001540]|uniref:hypothetical protein n=1 Tax=Kitasatospora sp. NPDC001540 TaxID=3364014 RepID=UPI00369F24AE